ncbi:hypothetical protein PIB30_096203, partial [Stylosanthes scabra]|nr:hypothetical protein [Stylosanthes scabra]
SSRGSFINLRSFSPSMATPLSSFYSGAVVVSDLRRLQQLLQEVFLLQELLLHEELLLCSKRSSSELH